MKKLVPLSVAVLLLGSTAAIAQNSPAFDKLDSDGNDKLSFSDLVGAWPDLTQAQFDAADLDGDDTLDLTEFEGLGLQGQVDVDVAASGTVSAAGADAPLFELLDADGDGKIGIDDLTDWPAVTQVEFDAADIDNDDFLDASQYEALKTSMGAMKPANVAVGIARPASDRPLFENLDSDGDGKVDFSSLKSEMPNLTQEQFDAADIDDDDFLDRTQYESLEM